jgi:hypothetical protein
VKKAQAGRLELVEMAVARRHQLVGPFGGSIERDRFVDPVVHREGLLAVTAINRRRGGIDEVS